MIAIFKQLPNGEMEYHTFCAFSSSSPSTKSSRHKFDLASNRPPRTVPDITGNQDVTDVYAGDPQPDFWNDAGAKLCSLYALCRSAGQQESGFARDMVAKGSIVPDATLNGVPHWNAGKSANMAAKKLQMSFAIAQAAKKNDPESIGQLGKSL